MLPVAVERLRALERWINSFERVSESLSEYENASKHLHSLCDYHDNTPKGQTGVDGITMEQAYTFLEGKFTQLECVERRLAQTLRALRGIRNNVLALVPVNKLHPELLTVIFRLSEHPEPWEESFEDQLNYHSVGSDQGWGDSARHVLPFAIVLSHVSRYWRNTAIDTVNLWTRIDFSGRYALNHKYLGMLIGRSKRAPLDARIVPRTYFPSAVETLGPHIPRVTSLTLHTFDQHEPVRNCLSNILEYAYVAPPVKNLVLKDRFRSSDDFSDAAGLELDKISVLMNNVETIHLDNSRLPFCPSFNSLTSLRLANDWMERTPSRSEFRNMLLSCPLLESLCFERIDMDVEDLGMESRIEMTSLHTMQFFCMGWMDLRAALHDIYPPHLCVLKIMGEFEDTGEHGEDMQAVAKFLSADRCPRSPSLPPAPSLEHLALMDMQRSADSWPYLMEILRATSKLRVLDFRGILLPPDIFEAITLPEDASELHGLVIPSLTTLTLYEVYHISNRLSISGPLMTMLESRAKVGRKVETLKIILNWDPRGGHEWKRHVLDELRHLVGKLVLRFEYLDPM